MTGMITYNPGVIADYAATMGQQAGQLGTIHEDVARVTNSLAEFFKGAGATEFFDLQSQMLSGLQGLIEVITHHQAKVVSANHGAVATDHAIGASFC